MSSAYISTSAGTVELDRAPEAGSASASSLGPTQHRWSPYDWNGGTVIAVAGADYAIIAADKRLATGYSIKSRNICRVHKVNDKVMIGCGGCHADVQMLYKVFTHEATNYRFDHGEDMSVVATAQLLSNTLYYKRFFPYYALSVVAGLERDGSGYVAGYDAVGSYLKAREGYTANGSASALVMPILDNAIGTIGVSSGLQEKPTYTKDEMAAIVKNAFITAGERDIMCGDAVDVYVITADGISHEVFGLKAD